MHPANHQRRRQAPSRSRRRPAHVGLPSGYPGPSMAEAHTAGTPRWVGVCTPPIQARLQLCRARLVSSVFPCLVHRPDLYRYWVSHVWTEAEPVAEGVRPPLDRDWYKRVKVRFDWVDNQGQPWWEQPEGTPPTRLSPVVEVEPSPASKRITMAQLVSPVDQEPEVKIVASQASEDKPDKKGALRYTDPQTGLLTPPITPPQTTDKPRRASRASSLPSEPLPSLITETSVLVGDSTTVGGSLRRRLPGDYQLAAFGQAIDSPDSTDTA